MSSNVSGLTASINIGAEGRSVLGISPSEDLAVDTVIDLAVDGGQDLSVFPGIHWAGASATEAVVVRGDYVQALEQPE